MKSLFSTKNYNKPCTQLTLVQQGKQHWWHTTIDQVSEKQVEVNLPTKEFKLLRAYFQMNLDKECFMGSDNSVKVIASIYGKKVQKILMIIAVVLLRVTIICIGSDKERLDGDKSSMEESGDIG